GNILSQSNKLFAAGANGVISISSDGVTWTNVSGLSTQQVWSVTYGNGLFVAVGPHGALRTSTDGISWTAQTVPASTYDWYGVAYGSNRFVAAGSGGIIMNSPNGSNWVVQSPGGPSGFANVAYGGGRFVIVRGGFS